MFTLCAWCILVADIYVCDQTQNNLGVVLQIGQVMLALPHAVSNTGMRAAVPLITVYTLVSMWTIHLLTSLYVDLKARKVSSLHACTLKRN